MQAGCGHASAGQSPEAELPPALCLITSLCVQFAVTQQPAGKVQNRAAPYMKESSHPGQHFLSSKISFCVNISILARQKQGQPFFFFCIQSRMYRFFVVRRFVMGYQERPGRKYELLLHAPPAFSLKTVWVKTIPIIPLSHVKDLGSPGRVLR